MQDELDEIKTGKLEANLKIPGTGTVRLEWEDSVITLEECMYIPDIVVNLISPVLLAKKGCNLFQEQDQFRITRGGQMVLKGLIRDSLFVIEKPKNAGNNLLINLTNQILSSSLNQTQSLSDIHKMYGHSLISTLKTILRDQYSKDELNDFQCDGCVKRKITRAPFSATSLPLSKPFKRIHLDLMGPITPQSKAGHRYILTLVDNCTGYLSAFPLTTKEETPDVIISILETEHKRLNYYPTEIFSNKGTEFTNDILKSFAKAKHIKLVKSEPYYSQHNGWAK